MRSFSQCASMMFVFMLMEMYKDVLLRKVWYIGAALLGLAICSGLSLYVVVGMSVDSNTTAIALDDDVDTCPVCTIIFKSVVFLVSVLMIFASFLSFYTCSNKKGDLVLKRHIEAFQSHMKRLKAAESRLRGALETMQLADKDMNDLQIQIKEDNEKARKELDNIHEINKRYMNGSRRSLLTEICELADAKGDKMYNEPEREQLLWIVSNMSGSRIHPLDQNADPQLKQLYAGLKLGEHALPESQGVRDTASGALCMREKDIVQVLYDLNALDLIMGMGDTTSATGAPPAPERSMRSERL